MHHEECYCTDSAVSSGDPLILPSSWKIVWCGLQCRAPMAFPAQLFHRPWSTQVAVMTEDARLVALHSLDTVAPILAPSPARPQRKASICKPDIWWLQICLRYFGAIQEIRRNKMSPGQLNYTVDMCFTEMINRQDVLLRIRGRTRVSQSEIVKEAWTDG